ncbi:MAG: DUF4394 domain-containing protein [Methylibium sp.]|nr:DUF4394 domain-containing protein [Methylibium sp.]
MQKFFKRSGVAAVMATALVAAVPAQAETLIGLTVTNRLVTFDSGNPMFGGPEIAITGLVGDERLLGIDLRPKTGELFAVSNASNLYTLNAGTGAASFVAALSSPLAGNSFGFDFNPVPDNAAAGPNSLRIMSDAGQNLRVQVATSGGATPAGDVIVDGALNGATNRLDGVAYANNDRNPATGTMLFGIDATSDSLYSLNANAGTSTLLGSLGLDVTAVVGFDIAGTGNKAFAALVIDGVGDAKTGLYEIDLASGAATSLGLYGVGGLSSGASQLQGLTVAAIPEPSTYALMLAGLAGVGFMARRRSARAKGGGPACATELGSRCEARHPRAGTWPCSLFGAQAVAGAPADNEKARPSGPRFFWRVGSYFAVGIANSAPLPVLSGQRCMIDFCRV